MTLSTEKRRQRLPIALFALLWQVPMYVVAFSPSPFGLGAILFRPSGIKTRPSLGGNKNIMKAADFFTDAFWTDKIGGGAKQLSDKQRKSLFGSQLLEFKRRYGNKMSSQDRRAELLLCENGKGELMGVAALEVEKIPESSLSSRILTRAPLMSNVAVSKKYRRRGIAESLVKQVELMAQNQWGYDECYLYVEERNKPAVRLYQKLGYRKIWTDKKAKTLIPTWSGAMQNAPTTIVCMKKRLKGGGIFGRLFP